MKAIIYILLMTTCVLGLAQKNTSEDIVVLSSRGVVKYTETPGGEDKAVIPGQRLAPTGNIFVDEGARVRIVVLRKSVLLTGPGRYDLAEIVSNTSTKSMSFTSRFWNFVMEGMGSTDDKKDLIKYHRDYMKIHGGIKGYTQEGTAIQLLSPLGGKIAAQEVQFNWKSNTSRCPVRFTLMDARRDVIYTKGVSDTHLQLSMTDLQLESNNTYYWSIGNKQNKAETEFTYMGQLEETVSDKLQYLEDYKDADEDEKTWMKAVILEMEGYSYDAHQLYKLLLDKDASNAFWKENYALFMSRQSRLDEASQLLNYD